MQEYMMLLEHQMIGREEGLAQGLAQGRTEGISLGVAEEKTQTIKELLKDKQSDEYIMKIARCTLKDIESVRNSSF